jgi:hypothetical protein
MCLPFLYLKCCQKLNCQGDGGGGEIELPPVLLDGGHLRKKQANLLTLRITLRVTGT